jgi:putative nucleotidyltransferase with HDIG domain
MSELRARVSDPDRLSHAVAVEAIMRRMAAAAGGAPEEWGLAGLLHDIDLAETKADPSRHGVVGARLLARLGFSEAVVRAVEAHDDATLVPRKAPIDHGLYCADRIYWAVRSSGLTFPSADASAATPLSVVAGLERRGARERIDPKLIQECGKVGLTLDGALGHALEGMRSVSAYVPP